MKKCYLLTCMLLMGALGVFAQNSDVVKFVTINKVDGNIIRTGDVADGATVNVSEVVVDDDGFNPPFISTGLGIENVTDSGKRIQIKYEVLDIDNGMVQCCLGSCTTATAVGTNYVPTLSNAGNHVYLHVLKKHEISDLSAEWIFAEDGKCTVRFTVLVGTKREGKTEADGSQIYDVTNGPSVTVNFLRGASGITDTKLNAESTLAYYDLSGRLVQTPSKGVYVVKSRTANGELKTRKVVFE